MRIASVLLFSICLFGVTFYGLSNESYYVDFLINLNTPFIYFRVAVVAVLLTYAFVPSLRLYFTKILLGLGGIIMLSLGIIGIGSPSFFGYLSSYMLLGDAFTLIEGGILAIVLSAELYSKESKFMVWSFAHLQLLLATRTRKLAYISPLQHSEKVLKTRIHLKPILSGDGLIDNLKGYQTNRLPYHIRPAFKYNSALKLRYKHPLVLN